MSDASIYAELRNRYNTGTVPLTEFPNESFIRPGQQKTPVVTWARFTVRNGEERRMDIGSPSPNATYRINGQLIIQLFAPLNSGSIALRTTADNIAGLFRDWCGATVTCHAASIRDVGETGDGWYQINIIIPFKQDALH